MALHRSRTLLVPVAGFVVVAVALLGCASSSPMSGSRSAADGASVDPVSSSFDSLLPIDPLVRKGRLDNGIRYIVRANERPLDRAELRLVVDAGSILEDEDQLGLAHFVEHMAFNGTENFAKQALVDYLESVGTRFGADLNAYTGFDETVYMLEVRTDSAEQFETGLEVLREWATRIAFDPEEIDRERAVIIEEWRGGRGAFARLRDVQLPVLLSGSRYAKRLPIGLPETLERFEHEALRRFYTTWYRPDLMSVVAVGDLDVEETVRHIERLFSDVPAGGDAGPRPRFDVPGHTEPLVSVATDPELPYGSVELVFKRESSEPGTAEAFRRALAVGLYSRMFNARLSERVQSPDPPYTMASSGLQDLVRGTESYGLSAIVRDGLYERAAEALLVETERVRRHGFEPTELERQKAEVLRAYERALAESDKTESARYASRYVSHLLDAAPIPGIRFEHAFVNHVLPEISIDEVNALNETFLTRENRVVLVSGPTSDASKMRDEAALLGLFDHVADLPIEPYVDATRNEPLMAAAPEAAAVTDRRRIDEIGLTQIALENGVRVWLKPTDFKADEVLLSAYSPGGTSLVPDSLFTAASFASELVAQSGVAEIGPITLEKMLAGRIVRIGPSISALSEGFGGSASPGDLETLFQLVHLYATAPRVDSVAFVSYTKRLGSLLQTSRASPRSAFADTIAVTMANYHPRAMPLSQETLDALDPHASLDTYRERFSDFSDFTFYIVGAFDLEETIALARRYLGTLPSTGRSESWRDVGIRPPEGAIEKTVYRGLEPQAGVRFLYTGEADWSMDERRLVSVLTEAFQIKLREVLREDTGGTYGVGVGGSLSRFPVGSFQLSVAFDCDPDRVPELVEVVERQVDSLLAYGLPESYLQKVSEATQRTHETNLRVNRFWLSSLLLYDQYALDPREIETGIRDFVRTLTPADLQQAARRYFGTPNVARFTLLPGSQSE